MADIIDDADAIVERNRDLALADLKNGIDRRLIITKNRCIQCDGRDWLTEKGNALCDDCQLELEESK